MKRTLAALFAGGLSLLVMAGLHSGVASAAQATAELDDGLLRWIVRSRWWRQVPEQPGVPVLSDIAHDTVTVSWTAPESAVFDIADYDVQYRESGSSSHADWPHEGTATEATVTGLAVVTEYEFRVRAASEAGAGDWSSPAVGTTLLAPPMFVEGETAVRELQENTPGGEAVGDPVTATAREGTLRYGLSGEDADAFAIDVSSGQIRTRQGVDYNFETRSSYAVEVEASEVGTGTGRIAVRISVLDVDEPPGQPVAPVLSVLGSTGLRVDWDAPVNTGPPIIGYDVEYRPGGTQDYQDADHEGTATHATITGLEPQTLYDVRVRAANDEGIGAWSDTSRERTSGGGGPQPPGSGRAPANQSAFDALFVTNFLSTENYFIQFLSGGRFMESDEHGGDYTYANTGPNTGTVTQIYDDTNQYGGSCTIQLTFASANEGTLSYACAGGESDTEGWRRDPMDTSSFNIEVIWSTSRPNAADRAMRAAVARWESVIAENLGAVYISGSSGVHPGVIDDLRVYARITDIDGPGGTFGRAGVSWIRVSSGLPVVSNIDLDTDDVGRSSSTDLDNVVIHEMAHALGFGTRWSNLGLLNDPATGANPNLPLPDTHFSGADAIAAFDAAGGTSYAGAKVPVENDDEAGGVDGHWRISVFGYGELMVGTLRLPSRRLPMSAITVQSMADLGYAVNAGAADGYGLPVSNAAPAPGFVSAESLGEHIPLRCIVLPPAPTDGVTLFELKPDRLR